ncbi:13306_t:CDS:2 [Cetraspora pellucida]|uniref:13306_t:CDS:1 n=1 Tax=Cetraspora pellucida TaxID=1433469 RepID=A0ACA9PCP7_9GLOM|nr:13306_t:CDS:2 [Cetraspora pellucida]
MALNKKSSAKKKNIGEHPLDEATAKPNKLKTHFAYKYKKVNPNIRIRMLILLTNDSVNSDNDLASTSTTASKKRKLKNSAINSEFETVPTLLSKEE